MVTMFSEEPEAVVGVTWVGFEVVARVLAIFLGSEVIKLSYKVNSCIYHLIF